MWIYIMFRGKRGTEAIQDGSEIGEGSVIAMKKWVLHR